jgi:hypothetical protein
MVKLHLDTININKLNQVKLLTVDTYDKYCINKY